MASQGIVTHLNRVGCGPARLPVAADARARASTRRGTVEGDAEGEAQAKLSYLAHVLMENRSGLLLDILVTLASRTAERDGAITSGPGELQSPPPFVDLNQERVEWPENRVRRRCLRVWHMPAGGVVYHAVIWQNPAT